MTVIKSREHTCSDSLVIALANLEIARRNFARLTNELRSQSALFDSDVMSAVLDQAADDIETHNKSIEQIKEELVDYLSNYLRN